MSKLLEETLEKLNTAEKFNERTKNVDDTELDRILAIRNEAKLEVWQEVTKLVEKHEKPKGLLQYVPSSLDFTKEQRDMYKSLKDFYEIYERVDEPAISGALAEVFNFGYIPEDDAVISVLKKFINEVEE